jgi:transcriptional regulator with PAS, ATPase and Fis domain
MKTILICWIGLTDIKASANDANVGLGPIGQAAASMTFDEINLISDRTDAESKKYISWLKRNTQSTIVVHRKNLSGPTNFGEIYESAVSVVSDTIKRHGDDISLTFHISPGTPAMAAVWIIISKTKFPATLIESSIKEGVKTVSIPFDISAEFIPDLLRKPDARLEQLSSCLPPDSPEFSHIIHRSQTMKRLVAKSRYIAPRSVSVLIEGKSGTGKELLARAIHESSPRCGKPFVAVNCGAIPSELVESELFGHEKGAFTGADRIKKGYFESADTGTLFLDEIGELPLPAQVKMLRALQEKEIVRVGSSIPKKIDVRVIAATNRDLIAEVTTGRFRSDLFYRIAVATLKLPPLKDRPGDISLLIDFFIEHINQESMSDPYFKHKKISPAAKNFMVQHQWPGNIRELQNTMLRAAIWSPDAVIQLEDIQEAIIPSSSNIDDNLLNHPIGDGFNLPALMQQMAKHYLKRALAETNGNKTKAAQMLGLSNYQTLSNWIKKYGID